MKLNNGKGWEAMKHHPSQHLHAANQPPNSSAVALNGRVDTPRGPGTPAAMRLNSQPLPQSPAKPGVKQPRDRPGASGAAPPKRQSGLAGGLTADVVTPPASTQAQFPNSNVHLPNNRVSAANPGLTQSSTSGAQYQRNAGLTDDKPTAAQKFMKALCCGNR